MNSLLRPGQFATLVILGVILWFVAAMMIRAIEPLGALQGGRILILFALVIPGTIPFILLARRVAKLRPNQTILAAAIVTASALLLDANAFAFFPSLYGADTVRAAATVFWGAGVAIFLGFWMNKAEDI